MKSIVKVFLVLIHITISTNFCFSQTLIMNEVSNGPAGDNKEYVEFVVVDNTVTYDCNSSVPPCIDIRGWIFDDNSGYHGTGGVASGACRFSLDPIWSCVPLGTIIVVYNNGDLNANMPPDDLSMADGNCRIVAPISNTTLFESNSTTPGAIACDYPTTGWTAGGSWSRIILANSGDCMRIVDLSGCEVFSVCWAENNQNTLIYFDSGGTVSNNVHYFNDGDPFLQANWTEGTCGSSGLPNDQTPGAPNNAANAAFISQFNNSCTPITPILVTATSIDAGCTCTGSATASSSGSIPGYTYEWFDDTYTTIGQTTETATGLCAGTYHVISTSSIGCSDTASVTLIAVGGVTVTVNDTTICSGQSATLTATPDISGGTYLWSPGGETTQSIIVSPAVSTDYSVIYTSGGCSATDTGTVTVNETPVLIITNPSPVCSPLTVDITAAAVTVGSTNVGTLSYWEDASATIVLASPSVVSVSETYFIQATNGSCTDIEEVEVIINPSPILTITDPAAVCSPSTVDITAAAVTAGSTDVGTLSYWEDAAATIVLASPSVVSVSETYFIQATNGSCTDIEEVEVIINQTPVLTITDPSPVCSPSTIDLTAAAVTAGSTDVGTLSYWEDVAATIVLASPSVVSVSETYFIQATNGSCTDIEEVEVIINQTPDLIITDPAAVCSPSTVDITAAAVTTGSTDVGSLSYWEDEAATIVLVSPSAITTSETYYIQATNGSCTDIEEVVVTIDLTPPTPSAGSDMTYCSNWDFTPMTVVGTGGTYTWYSDFELNLVISTGGELTPNDAIGTTVYYVTEKNNQCESPADSVTITIEDCEIIVPTAFTPDGDNVNDYWEIVDLDTVYPNNVVMVYNRWGSLLFQSEEGQYASSPWKGDYNGEMLPVGSYYFILDFNSEKTEPMKGVVSIILN